MTPITPKQAALISSLATLGVCSLLAAYPVGYFVASRRRQRLSEGKDFISEYNKTCIAYNLTVVRFNRALEEKYEMVPSLKELMDLQEKEIYNAIFDDMMREEF